MIPMLLHHTGDIIAQVDVLIISFLAGFQLGALRLGIAAINEFVGIAVATEGTWNTHWAISMKVRLCALTLLVDEMASSKTVEAISGRNLVRSVGRDQVSE